MDILLVEVSKPDAEEVRQSLLQYEAEHPRANLGLCWVDTKVKLANALTDYKWAAVLTAYALEEMPWPTVLEMTRKIAGSGVPVIVVSRFADYDQGVDAIRQGAADYVSKSDLSRLGHVIVRETMHANTFGALMSLHSSVQNGRPVPFEELK